MVWGRDPTLTSANLEARAPDCYMREKYTIVFGPERKLRFNEAMCLRSDREHKVKGP